MPIFHHQGLSYHYRRLGRGPNLLLLHGFTGSLASWESLFPALVPYFSLLLLDLPGHGQTAAPKNPQRASMRRVGDDIAALLSDLALDRSLLAGYSMGGRLALYLLSQFPALFPAALLESASPGLATGSSRRERRARDEILAGRIETEGIEPFVDSWERLPLFASQRLLPADVRHGLRAERLRNSAAGLAASLRGMGTGAQPNLWPHLPLIAQPVHLIAGSLDGKFVQINEQMATLLPRNTLSIAQGCGHNVHLERPDWCAEVLLTALLT